MQTPSLTQGPYQSSVVKAFDHGRASIRPSPGFVNSKILGRVESTMAASISAGATCNVDLATHSDASAQQTESETPI